MCLSFLEMCLHIVYLENAFVSHESDGLVVSMILERVMSQSGFHWPHGDKSRQPTFYSVTGEKMKVWCGCQPNYHHGAVEAEVEAEVEPEQLSHKSNKSTWATAKPRTKGKGGGCQWRRTRVRSLLSRVVLLWYLHSICNWWKIQVRQPSPSRPFLISLMFLMHIVFRVCFCIYTSHVSYDGLLHLIGKSHLPFEPWSSSVSLLISVIEATMTAACDPAWKETCFGLKGTIVDEVISIVDEQLEKQKWIEQRRAARAKFEATLAAREGK